MPIVLRDTTLVSNRPQAAIGICLTVKQRLIDRGGLILAPLQGLPLAISTDADTTQPAHRKNLFAPETQGVHIELAAQVFPLPMFAIEMKNHAIVTGNKYIIGRVAGNSPQHAIGLLAQFCDRRQFGSGKCRIGSGK
jgi:hypothetical protein